MLDYKVEVTDDIVLEQEARPPRKHGPFVRGAVLVFAVALMVGGILLMRGWRPTASSSNRALAAMPISADIEAKYGIRFTLVDVTAGGGMLQLRYQVLDSDKTGSIHDVDVAPFIVDSKGAKYADPGMVGHSHVGKAKSPGTTDFILLSNARGGVTPGSIVTIKVGTLELRNVPVR